MPVAPELRHRGGEKGRCKVFHQVDAQKLCAAHGNGGVAIEIAVDLDGKQQRRQRQIAAGIEIARAIDRVDIERETIRDHKLEEEAPEDDEQPFPQIVKAEAVGCFELAQQVSGAFNGPRHKLGEEGDKQGIGEEIPLGLNLAPVHIHGVAEGLEGIEGDAHREQNIHRRDARLHMQKVQSLVQKVNGEVKILEKEEDAKVGDKAQRHDPLFPPLDRSGLAARRPGAGKAQAA